MVDHKRENGRKGSFGTLMLFECMFKVSLFLKSINFESVK